ncbi:surface lipoprotein assembly modifier [Alloyangia pacifica]|uniref:Tetratricopeptide repeat-containing protein n=1 Tax=Alloyangia pacifica TaxID=311180 RepID=A0A1I6ULB8_9RHOB|nr:surface lipoprotein assembly modifier [Alloyangia pacifica]SDH74508.1 Tetratricopeptide repeat-containing protein [Alloyangia pacifica]SFT02276.1 Tetratricopeptide repeat-containing protein [Alloyangia pacifica]
MRATNIPHAGPWRGLAVAVFFALQLPGAQARAQESDVPPVPAAAAPAEIEAGFQQALAALAQRQPEAAVRLLRRLLASDPSLLRVRLELARALFEAREYAQSREQFRIVLSNPDLPPSVRGNILRFMRAIDERRGLRTRFSFALRAPEGAGRSYDSDEVETILGDPPLVLTMNREDPPLTGLELAGALRKQWPLRARAGGATLSAYVQADGNLYQTGDSDWDELGAELSAGLQLTWPQTTAWAEAIAGTDYFGGEMIEERFGLGAGVSWRGASGLTASVETEVMDVTLGSHPDIDVTRASARLSVIRPLRGRTQIAASLSLQHQEADRDDLSYDYAELRLGARSEVGGGFLIEPSVYAASFDQIGATPLLGKARHETEYGIELRIDKTDTFLFGRLTPYVQIEAARRDSNFDVYSYRDLRISAGLTSAF